MSTHRKAGIGKWRLHIWTWVLCRIDRIFAWWLVAVASCYFDTQIELAQPTPCLLASRRWIAPVSIYLAATNPGNTSAMLSDARKVGSLCTEQGKPFK